MSEWTLRQSGEQMVTSSMDEVLTELEVLGSRDEPTAELFSESGDSLMISVAGPLALIIFTPASLEPPYLSPISSAPPECVEEDVVEFIVGGTLTPVPRERCVSVTTMLRVVRHYIATGELPAWITWGDQ